MADLIQGVVSRIFVQQPSSGSMIVVSLKLEDSKMIYSGQMMVRDSERDKILLTKPGDTVDFTFTKDFSNHFRAFFNHTLEGELERDDD
jgi:hypothetical protein